jgi:hypothetical protein
MAANRMIEVEMNIGEPIFFEGGRLIPFARSLIFRSPWRSAMLIWNRPAAVLVKKDDGQEKVIPIIDLTRRLQIALFGGALLGALLIGLRMQKRIRS